jgi:hypothetical protein
MNNNGNDKHLIKDLLPIQVISAEAVWIDTLIEKIKSSVELLREYRTTLISTAVTGKIDVRREAAA